MDTREKIREAMGHDPWNGCLGGKIGDPCPGCGFTRAESASLQACPLLNPFNENPEIAKDFAASKLAYETKYALGG